MKSATLIFSLGLIASLGADVSVTWPPSPDAGVAGYNLYYGTASRAYQFQQTTGTNLAASVSGLDPGRSYFFAVTAYDADGIESDFSGETAYDMPEVPVLTTNIVTVSVPVLSATNLNGPWTPETVFTISYTNPPGTKFFKFGLAITQTNQ